MRKTKFAKGEFYHIYNRGVDKRVTFNGQRDYERFLFLLFACNDSRPLLNSQFFYRGLASIEEFEFTKGKRNKLVDIICFCLMPNHFHLLLKQKLANGISIFMQKITTGYSMYFNKRNERSGSLFQGPYKAIHVNEDRYLKHLTCYLHLNPAELKEPKWKEKDIPNIKSMLEFIKNYQWSSYSDYLGINRFRKILSAELIPGLFGKASKYEEFISQSLKGSLGLIDKYTIEA